MCARERAKETKGKEEGIEREKDRVRNPVICYFLVHQAGEVKPRGIYSNLCPENEHTAPFPSNCRFLGIMSMKYNCNISKSF